MTDVHPPPKPPHGAPCNGCGGCCLDSLCRLAQHVFQNTHQGPCPALTFDSGGRSSCGLVANPSRYAPVVTAIWGGDAASAAASLLVGTGLGCDGLLEGERRDTAFSQALRIHRHRHDRSFRTAEKVWRLGTLSRSSGQAVPDHQPIGER